MKQLIMKASYFQNILKIMMMFLIGACAGLISKYLDTIAVMDGDYLALVLSIAGNMTTGIGVWIFLGSLITVLSSSAKIAAIHVFSFCSGMLIAYYGYSMVLFGFFPTNYFIFWGIVALGSPICAYILWFSRNTGWLAAIVGALPIGVLLKLGASFFYTYEFLYLDPPVYSPLVQLFDLIFAGILFFIVFKTNQQKFKTAIIVILVGALLWIISI